MKNDKVDFAAKVAPKSSPIAAETDSPAEKNVTGRAGSCEKSTKFVSKEAAEIYALLRLDLLKDMDVCAKFVDGVKGVVGTSSFVKHMTEDRRIALLVMMQKIAILVAKSMLLDQEDTKAAKEVVRTMAAEAYSSAKRVKKLEFEVAVLKGSNIFALTSLQLETAC
ncbi:hypothetical protein PS2_022720 [Malus domestica]